MRLAVAVDTMNGWPLDRSICSFLSDRCWSSKQLARDKRRTDHINPLKTNLYMKCHFVPLREDNFCPVQNDRQYTYKVTLMRFPATTVAVEKQ